MIFIAVAARTRRRTCSYVFVVGASAADATVFAAVSAAALYNRFDRPGRLSRDRSGHVAQRCALLFFPSVAREAVEETVVGRSFVVGETSLPFLFLGLMPEFSSKPGTSTFAAIWSREGKLSGGVAARWTVPAQKALAVRAYCFFRVVRDDVTLVEEFLSVAVNPLRTVQAQKSLSVRAGGEGEALLQVIQECRTCGVQFRVRAKAAFAANARTNASRLAVFSRLVVHDGLCVKPPQAFGRSDRRRRRRHAARVSSARGIHYTGPSERRRRSRTKPRSVERSAVTAAAAAKGVRARLRSGNCLLHYLRQQPITMRTMAARARPVPTLPQSRPPSSSWPPAMTALAAFLAAGAKDGHLVEHVVLQSKKDIKACILSHSLSHSLSLSFSLSFSL
jgi:hypothetical protein